MCVPKKIKKQKDALLSLVYGKIQNNFGKVRIFYRNNIVYDINDME
jgi:hypothetical protein